MRAALPLLATLCLVAACSNEPRQVDASPPTVSYRVNGNDISQANVSANQYCQRYGTAAQFQGLQATGSGNTALYACTNVASSSVAPYYGSSTAPGYSNAPPPPPYYSGSSIAPVQCADRMHQNRPGGTDYYGPPVAGCPPIR